MVVVTTVLPDGGRSRRSFFSPSVQQAPGHSPAEVDAISIDLVRGLVEGMLSVLARYIPLEREVEALDALYAWQASLLPGIVRL
jgi:hypothetical protein